MARVVAAFWGVGGVVLMLLEAINRLARRALALREMELDVVAWLALLGSLVFFGVFEGYRGFQQHFAPRVVARARHLLTAEPAWVCALAPLFTMALIRATRRRLIASWVLLVMIVVLILLIRLLPAPWREIVDAGVVLGLSWGTLAIVVFAIRALVGHPPTIALDLPELLPSTEKR